MGVTLNVLAAVVCWHTMTLRLQVTHILQFSQGFDMHMIVYVCMLS